MGRDRPRQIIADAEEHRPIGLEERDIYTKTECVQAQRSFISLHVEGAVGHQIEAIQNERWWSRVIVASLTLEASLRGLTSP